MAVLLLMYYTFGTGIGLLRRLRGIISLPCTPLEAAPTAPWTSSQFFLLHSASIPVLSTTAIWWGTEQPVWSGCAGVRLVDRTLSQKWSVEIMEALSQTWGLSYKYAKERLMYGMALSPRYFVNK